MKPFLVVLFLVLGSFALGGWGKARYCRLTQDRFLIVRGADRFILNQDAAWNLEDPKQANLFGKWLKEAELPKDLGLLIQGAPTANEIKLLSQVRLVKDKSAKIEFSKDNSPQAVVTMIVSGGELVADSKGEASFQKMASGFGLKGAQLLKDLAGGGGWGQIVTRLRSHEFFVYEPSLKGIFWGVPTLQPVAASAGQPTQAVAPVPKGEVKPGPKANPTTLWTYLVALLFVVVAGTGWYLAKGKNLGIIRRVPRVPVASFPVSAHERELISKVRDELAQSRFQKVLDPEAAVVGKMMEAYDQIDSVAAERDSLIQYRAFKEQFSTFDDQLKATQKETKSKDEMLKQLKRQLEKEQLRLADLQMELQQTNNSYQVLQSTLEDANRLVEEFGNWCDGLTDKLATLEEKRVK